jgi:hypothetical protein
LEKQLIQFCDNKNIRTGETGEWWFEATWEKKLARSYFKTKPGIAVNGYKVSNLVSIDRRVMRQPR